MCDWKEGWAYPGEQINLSNQVHELAESQAKYLATCPPKLVDTAFDFARFTLRTAKDMGAINHECWANLRRSLGRTLIERQSKGT